MYVFIQKGINLKNYSILFINNNIQFEKHNYFAMPSNYVKLIFSKSSWFY